MASLCSLSLSVSEKPTHIVMWQDSNSDTLSNLTERIACLEKAVASLASSSTVKRTPLISGIGMTRSLDCSGSLCAVINEGNAANLMKEVIAHPFSLSNPYERTPASSSPSPVLDASVASSAAHRPSVDICPEDSSMDEEEAEDAPEDDSPEDDAPEDDAPEELEEEEEEVMEDEEEEVAVEYEEIEYKGVTYYKDSENQVYLLDEDGDLDDTPVGIWNEQKQKVLKYATA
jgi:hypothetical protein